MYMHVHVGPQKSLTQQVHSVNVPFVLELQGQRVVQGQRVLLQNVHILAVSMHIFVYSYIVCYVICAG